MNDTAKRDLAQLSASLNYIAGLLEGWDRVDVDDSWMDKGPPPEKPIYGPKHAIANVRKTDQAIADATRVADNLPDHPLVYGTKVTLCIATEAICQADVPAEYALLNGDSDGAVECCRDGLQRAYAQCGTMLKTLSAQLGIAVTSGLPPVPNANGDDAAEWSLPATHRKWEKRFNRRARTLREWRTKGTIRMEKVGRGLWRVATADPLYIEWERSRTSLTE